MREQFVDSGDGREELLGLAARLLREARHGDPASAYAVPAKAPREAIGPRAAAETFRADGMDSLLRELVSARIDAVERRRAGLWALHTHGASLVAALVCELPLDWLEGAAIAAVERRGARAWRLRTDDGTAVDVESVVEVVLHAHDLGGTED